MAQVERGEPTGRASRTGQAGRAGQTDRASGEGETDRAGHAPAAPGRASAATPGDGPATTPGGASQSATQRTFTNAARRSQIVAAAIETIAELGYAKASFARITERAGLSSPRMISYHFADKDDLMHQVVREVFTAGAEFIGGRMAAEQTVAGKLRAYLEANVQFLRDHPRQMLALTEIGPHARDAGGAPYTSHSAQEPSLRGLEDLLASGQRSGEFREFDVASMAVMIRGAVDAAAVRLSGAPALDVDAYSRELVTAFTRATETPR